MVKHKINPPRRKRRGITSIAIKLKGSKCESCGYKQNFAALEFHHVDPKTRLFQLDLRSLSNRKWEVVLKEADKCRLLCSNCHAELHNPDCEL